MGTHAYHNELPGYDARQIWHDGCDECEWRSQNLPSTVGYLDINNLHRAIQRTKMWINGEHGDLGRISQAELPLLQLLEVFLNIRTKLSRTV